jgi:hypothetical protein
MGPPWLCFCYGAIYRGKPRCKLLVGNWHRLFLQIPRLEQAMPVPYNFVGRKGDRQEKIIKDILSPTCNWNLLTLISISLARKRNITDRIWAIIIHKRKIYIYIGVKKIHIWIVPIKDILSPTYNWNILTHIPIALMRNWNNINRA